MFPGKNEARGLPITRFMTRESSKRRGMSDPFSDSIFDALTSSNPEEQIELVKKIVESFFSHGPPLAHRAYFEEGSIRKASGYRTRGAAEWSGKRRTSS